MQRIRNWLGFNSSCLKWLRFDLSTQREAEWKKFGFSALRRSKWIKDKTRIGPMNHSFGGNFIHQTPKYPSVCIRHWISLCNKSENSIKWDFCSWTFERFDIDCIYWKWHQIRCFDNESCKWQDDICCEKRALRIIASRYHFNFVITTTTATAAEAAPMSISTQKSIPHCISLFVVRIN